MYLIKAIKFRFKGGGGCTLITCCVKSEECDNFVLDYVSFSKNSLSGELVMHFLFYLTLKHKDPRISHVSIAPTLIAIKRH